MWPVGAGEAEQRPARGPRCRGQRGPSSWVQLGGPCEGASMCPLLVNAVFTRVQEDENRRGTGAPRLPVPPTADISPGSHVSLRVSIQ